MSYRQDVLEVVFHSATDLPKPSFSMKEANPYVMADIISPDTKPNWIKTTIVEKGGENPVWDYVIHFPLNQRMVYMARNFKLVGKIMHSGTVLGNREIGCVKVRLSLLLDGAAAGEKIPYPVVVSGGEERGKIFISHIRLTSIIAAPHSHNQVLELIFHSAIGLTHPLFNHKGSPYVLASIVSLDTKPNWFKTVTAEKDGENLVWDYVIPFPLNQEMVCKAKNVSLVCKIMHLGNILGDTKIGHINVPLQDFLAGTGENIPYPVMISGGVGKGTIVISHKLVTNTASMGVDVSAPLPMVIEDPNHDAELNAVRLVGRVTTIVGSMVWDFIEGLTD